LVKCKGSSGGRGRAISSWYQAAQVASKFFGSIFGRGSAARAQHLDGDLGAEHKIGPVLAVGEQQAQRVFARRRIEQRRGLPLAEVPALVVDGEFLSDAGRHARVRQNVVMADALELLAGRAR